jgi:acyl-CoA thioesterase II
MALPHFDLIPAARPGQFTWIPPRILETPGVTVQGGASLGAAITAMEALTERPFIWATAQFLSNSRSTETIDIEAKVAVAGRSTSQASCVLSQGGTELLSAFGSLGSRPPDVDGAWCRPPDVAPPDDCDHFEYFTRGKGHIGDLAEIRSARLRTGPGDGPSTASESGHFALWIRCWEGQQKVSAADLSVIGDFMPIAFAEVLGAPYIGNSLDNSVRSGCLVPTEWILMAVHVDQVTRGFGHGRAELWAEDGSLLGTVSQTSVLRYRPRPRSQP